MEEFEHLRIPMEFIKHATKNFSDGHYVAEGGFGKVYRGEFFDTKGLTIGAVKRLDRSKDQADVSFWREIMMLSTYKHKNLISLVGFCDEYDERILVYEYASNKSLDFHLLNPDLTWIQRLKICLGAACGLQYLHDPKGSQQRVLHRDIKSANILLDENWNAKIADFGLSKYGPANQQHTFLFSDAKGTLGYCDPAYIDTMLLTKESDVYSFGVVLFEVLCSRHCVDYSYNDERRSLPILVKKCYQEQTLDTIIDVNLRRQMKQNSFDTFVKVAYQCVERDRTRRPSMDLIVNKLATALKYQEGEGDRKAEVEYNSAHIPITPFNIFKSTEKPTFEESMEIMKSMDEGREMPENLQGGILIDKTYVVPPKDLNSFLFAPDSQFQKDIAALRGITDVHEKPWTWKSLYPFAWESDKRLTRTVTYMKAATKLVKSSKAVEEQTYIKANGKEFSVSVRMSSLDHAWMFEVELLYNIKLGGDETSRITVSWVIKLRESRIMKDMVEGNAYRELKETFDHFAGLLGQRFKSIDQLDLLV